MQHIGAPCSAVVKARAEVQLGELVGRSEAFVCAPVHASISGTVGRLTHATLPNGRHVEVLPIKAAEEQPLEGRALFEDVYGGEWRLDGLEGHEPEAIADAAASGGLVGLGGAGFPSHVKLRRNPDKPIDTVLINGAECEPYLNADYRLMVEAPDPIVSGALLARRATGANDVIVCIEDNKSDAVAAVGRAAEGTAVEVSAVETKYPQGGEKQLISTVLGREVPLGGLPLDVGVVVLNVATSAALARAVLRGKPLTHRIVTVSGAGIREPKNLLVPIGASYRALLDYCGGLTDDAARVVAGGPMTGFTLGDADTPVTKGTGGVTVLTAEDIRKTRETTCLRCGRCMEVCPMRLVPSKIALAARAGNADLVNRYHADACIECGCCAYECPASVPLVQLIRVGKVIQRKAQES